MRYFWNYTTFFRVFMIAKKSCRQYLFLVIGAHVAAICHKQRRMFLLKAEHPVTPSIGSYIIILVPIAIGITTSASVPPFFRHRLVHLIVLHHRHTHLHFVSCKLIHHFFGWCKPGVFTGVLINAFVCF
jgi:hypothetical protein